MPRANILIVEDDSEMADVLRQGFEHESYQVHVAYNGAEALATAARNMFQAIVLDVMLPVVDGFTVARRLRGAGNTTPILMLTACDSLANIVTGLDSGAEDYLTKPFSFLELAARMRALIRRGEPALANLRSGDLILDAASRLAYRSGKAIHLTPTELRLLEMLLKSAGRVVARQELVDGVWGGVSVEENSLDVTVSALRAKVDRGHARKLIHTVRGFGYRIGGPD